MLYAPGLNSLLAEFDEDPPCGGWTRVQLMDMDLKFCEAVERGFTSGGESRAAAKATVQVGRAGAVEMERAIEAAWQFARNADFDSPFSEIVAHVQARCGGVDSVTVRAGFERRFKNGGVHHDG
jgi:hypothetical protein